MRNFNMRFVLYITFPVEKDLFKDDIQEMIDKEFNGDLKEFVTEEIAANIYTYNHKGEKMCYIDGEDEEVFDVIEKNQNKDDNETDKVEVDKEIVPDVKKQKLEENEKYFYVILKDKHINSYKGKTKEYSDASGLRLDYFKNSHFNICYSIKLCCSD